MGPIVLLVQPVLHGNRKTEWRKLSQENVLKELQAELIHIHASADKKNAPFAYKPNLHWRDLVTDESDKPYDGQTRKIVLTSSHTWKPRVQTLFVEKNSFKYNNPVLFCPGWIIRDEFTVDKGPTARTCKILTALKKKYHRSRPFKVFMSGMPIEPSPTDIVGVLTALAEPSWETIGHEMYGCRPSRVMEIGKDMNRLINGNTGVDEPNLKQITSEFEMMLPLFLFRRDKASTWFGDELVKLPDLRVTTHDIALPGSCQDKRREMNEAWIKSKQAVFKSSELTAQ